MRFGRAGLGLLLATFTLATTGRGDEGSQRPVVPQDTLPETIDLGTIRQRLLRLGAVTPDDPLTQEKVSLGRRLFFDTVLSKDRTVSCASCHQPEHGFASPDAKAVGIRGQVGRRNSPTLMNRALGKLQFWDGRAASLEAQALQPIGNPLELGHSVDDVVKELATDPDYVELFATAFGGQGEAETEDDARYVTSDNLAKSLAAFQRTLLTGDSPVDRFQTGKYEALSKDERQGLWIFESRGRCWKCHSGNNYSDEAFHNTGIGFGRSDRDPGRYEVTKLPADKGKFKTPTLRAIARTAPYMHDGSLASLTDVVEFYNNGGEFADPLLDKEVSPLGLSEKEIAQLVAFLEALSKERLP